MSTYFPTKKKKKKKNLRACYALFYKIYRTPLLLLERIQLTAMYVLGRGLNKWVNIAGYGGFLKSCFVAFSELDASSAFEVTRSCCC